MGVGKGNRFGGRKKGTPNKRTIVEQQVLERFAAKKGKKTPLEVMLEACDMMQRTSAKYVREGDNTKALECMKLAVDFAAKAAPYVHNRLASLEHSGLGGRALPTPQINVVFVEEDE